MNIKPLLTYLKSSEVLCINRILENSIESQDSPLSCTLGGIIGHLAIAVRI
ncbi:MAG: hypothetical protein NHB32_01305 [Fischerella sp. CENA71]|nr:hypothetical protein [Fischerella sp. CENA71]